MHQHPAPETKSYRELLIIIMIPIPIQKAELRARIIPAKRDDGIKRQEKRVAPSAHIANPQKRPEDCISASIS
jgi:hypothetical protein